jgi:tetratricopeptide (TPR) repeat protein
VTARLAEIPFWTLEKRDRFAAEALAMAERLGDLKAMWTALFACYTLGFRPGRADERLEFTTRMVRVTEAAGAADAALQAHSTRYQELLVQGRASESEAELRAVEEWAERTGEPGKRAIPPLLRAGRALWEGRFDEAETRAAEALSELGSGLGRHAVQMAASLTFCLRAFQGRLSEMAPPLESIPEVGRWAANGLCARMWMFHRLGRGDAARRVLEAVVPDEGELPVEYGRFSCLAMLSEVAAGLGDRGRCERLLAELEPEAGLQLVAGSELLVGCASRPLGLLARALGRVDEAERHFEVALEADTRIGARPWVAETQLEYAALLLERGGGEGRRRAEALLDQACATAAELGMAAVLRRAELLRR